MTTRVPAALRRAVIDRAANCCEYCRLSQPDYPFAFHIEHIITEKHGGQTALSNLALSCPDCNTYKGSDLSSVDWEGTEEITPLYNPRKHLWLDHFHPDNARISPLTSIGRATVFLLRLNDVQRLEDRMLLATLSRWPCGDNTT
jgi:hypothetical protein